ncbi:class II aldolase/adducin family protein [Bacillus sp. FJAT-50079]|uniref:class II aldolase/adducin family protein n=1 Tax=Bacillus sp. FJAT-50079 TaxID=2833577 RepID=UPI001BCA4919|nr:class II aldolase/adducin family protein [Bacillus sp. FJAT-50079]MBS4206991.1 class II aldolase/adducin family protein [Bacillus sp. FJAT-50079]
MNDHFIHPADQLVMMMDRIYQYGMTTISGGNLSILDDHGDLWITPSGIDKGELKRTDIMCVKKDGTIEGIHRPSVELPFHQGIYEARPDIKAVVHAHPPALVSFSMARKAPNDKLIPNAYANVGGKIGIAAYAIPGSEKLKKNIAEEFEKGSDAVILENHGIVIGKSNIFEAFSLFETLEDVAYLEINARILGIPHELSKQSLQKIDMYRPSELKEFTFMNHTNEEVTARKEMCKLIQRLYSRQLFISTAGSFSTRLSDGSVLITPYKKDRNYMEVDDLVLIKGNLREQGKIPCDLYELHTTIYEKHPDVNSVIIANPRYLMAFAITDTEYNTHIIPEAYIVLRDIHKVPFGIGEEHDKMIADKIAKDNPVLLVENGYAVVTADSLLSSFDMLEVAEYSAKALVYSKNIGEVINISEEEIEEITVGFNLVTQ